MDRDRLCEIAGKTGTPAYVFDKDVFRDKAGKARAQACGIGLCYSLKANPFLADPFFEADTLFDLFEVCSPGELRICVSNGVPSEKILFSGINKSTEDIEEAYLSGVRLFTAESEGQLASADSVGKKHGCALNVLIRIAADTQFGMDGEAALGIMEKRRDYGNTDIQGIHYFTGTQKRSYTVIEKEIGYLKDFCSKAQSEYGFKVKRVEYGPGLDVPYFKDQRNGADDLKEIIPLLKELADMTDLTIEMGRYFAAECGTYLTKVVECKENGGTKYAITDGGMHQLHYDGQVKSMKIPCYEHIKNNSGGITEKWTVCGSICSTEDVICRDAVFTGLDKGDLIAYLSSGAYSFMESMSTFLSREMPRIWAYSGKDELKLLRDYILTDRFNRSMEDQI